jgi:hypothetical protein
MHQRNSFRQAAQSLDCFCPRRLLPHWRHGHPTRAEGIVRELHDDTEDGGAIAFVLRWGSNADVPVSMTAATPGAYLVHEGSMLNVHWLDATRQLVTSVRTP